tara:strand:+ start:963 stop:1163 length:201 start_codon:yes stop_codon:yes gene_type:complete
MKYKYLIINEKTNEVSIENSYRNIENIIKNAYKDDTISHNTISERLKEKNHFRYYDIIIKKLIWTE